MKANLAVRNGLKLTLYVHTFETVQQVSHAEIIL